MKNYLPHSISRRLSLPSLLARSGFVFVQEDACLDFRLESKENKVFLGLLLNGIGGFQLIENKIAIPKMKIDQSEWLGIWQANSGGAEGGPTCLLSMELRIMDAYMSGIVRWLTALGYTTTSSCDGHGLVLPRLDIRKRELEEDVYSLITRISNRRIVYGSPYLCPNQWQSRDVFYGQLLDLAENLYTEAQAVIHEISNTTNERQ